MPNSSQLPKSDARGSFVPAAPFKYNPAERPLEDIEETFVGRQEVLERLVTALKEQSGAESLQHYLLLGPRGIGKTTLLLMLQKEIDTDPDLSLGWLPVRFGEEEFFVYTLRDLLALTLDYLATEGRAEEAQQILSEVDSEPDDQISLARAVDGLREISRKCRRRILLLIDNFDQIFPKKASGIDARSLRKLLSTESFLMVIGSSVKVFEEVASYDEAFFNFFSPVYVDDLNDSQIQELLHKLALRDGNQAFLRQEKAQRDKIRAITFLTGGNPRLVMMLYEILSRQQFQPVVQALRATIDGLTPLLKDVLEGLSRQQAKILDAVMRSGGIATPAAIAERVRLPLNAVTTQLGRLKQARLLEVEGGGKGRKASYRVHDPMFRTWYQMRYLRPARRRIEIFVEFLQAWFSVEERIAMVAQLQRKFQGRLDDSPNQARELAIALEYFAASLDTISQRWQLMGCAADAYLALGDVREAALSLGELMKSSETTEQHEVGGYLALGSRLYGKGLHSEAEEAFSKVLEKNPENQLCLLVAAACSVRAGDDGKALHHLGKLLSIEGLEIEQSIQALKLRGGIRYDNEDLQGALADLGAIVALEEVPAEDKAEALCARGEIHSEQGDLQASIDDFDAVIELEGVPVKYLAHAYCYRGTAWELQENLERAAADFSAVIELEDAPVDLVTISLSKRGTILHHQGDLQGMLRDFVAISEFEGAPTEFLAVSLLFKGLNRGSQADLKEAVLEANQLFSSSTAPQKELFPRTLRALAYKKLNFLELAVEDLQICLKSKTDSELFTLSLRILVEILAEQGEFDKIRSWVEQMPELEPKDTPVKEALETRIKIVTTVAQHLSPDHAARILQMLRKNSGAELSARLAFMEPALELAVSGDESALSGLVEEEQKLAHHIVEKIESDTRLADQRESATMSQKLAEDYRAGVEDNKNLLQDLEKGQLDLLGNESQ